MKGIMFKPEMIQAILEGRKTVTRRVIDPQPKGELMGHSDYVYAFLNADGEQWIKPKYIPGETVYIKEAWQKDGKKMSPMFMPESAARIFLTIDGVYPERLHDMPFEDIEKEGTPIPNEKVNGMGDEDHAKVWWIRLWNSVAKSDEFRHDKNPWVWVYRFSVKEVRK